MIPKSDRETVGRRERRKAITREELLVAGRRLFSEKGLYEARVEEITEKAGIGKGTLYRYFRNKDELVVAVVSAGFNELGQRVEEWAAGARSLEKISAAIVKAHLEFFTRNPDLMRIFHQMRGMLKFNRAEWLPLRRILCAHLALLARLLARATHPRLPGEAHSQRLAGLLFGAVSGAFSVRIAADPKAQLEPAFPGFTEALVGMVQRFASLQKQLPDCT